MHLLCSFPCVIRDFSLAARISFRGQSDLVGGMTRRSCDTPGRPRDTGKSGEQLGWSPRLETFKLVGCRWAVFPQHFHMLWKYHACLFAAFKT